MNDGLGVILGPLKMLHPNEMREIVEAENREDYIVAGYYDYLSKQLILFRGNGESIEVPIIYFRNFDPTIKAPVADPEQLEIIDYGLTVKLGLYEAATDCILYDMDPKYKAKVDAKARD